MLNALFIAVLAIALAGTITPSPRSWRGRCSGAHIGAGTNTQWDLVFNLAGVLAMVSFQRWGAVDRH